MHQRGRLIRRTRPASFQPAHIHPRRIYTNTRIIQPTNQTTNKPNKQTRCRLTRTWSIWRLGSAVMTVRPEKSTRFPIRLPRMRPSFPRSRWRIVLSTLPDLCFSCSELARSLSKKLAIFSCGISSLGWRLGGWGGGMGKT
jgi:hypothetical protein